MIERKNYPHLPVPAGPYVQAVKHNGLLFLSGLTAFGTHAEGRPIAEQADAIFTLMEGIASAEKLGFQHLLKVTIFVTQLDDIAQLRAALLKRYGEFLPASSLVQVSRLFSDQLSIEIEATFGG